MKCPNNCTGLVQNILVDTPSEYYAKTLAKNIESRKGVESTRIEINTDHIKIILQICQEPYKNYNHFYYREDYEENEEFGVIDIDDDKVALIYEGHPVTQAYRCMDCKTVFHQDLDVTNDDEIDPTEIDWSLPI